MSSDVTTRLRRARVSDFIADNLEKMAAAMPSCAKSEADTYRKMAANIRKVESRWVLIREASSVEK